MPDAELPFWESKPLEKLSRAEWEALCDGCARCCLIKFEDEETGEILLTDVVCKLLDLQICRCGDYKGRSQLVPTCLVLTPKLVRSLEWMPETCAYRLLAKGMPLAWWHPLVSGDPWSVHRAGISVRGWAVSERHVPEEELEDHVLDEQD